MMRYEKELDRWPRSTRSRRRSFTDRNWGVIATIREDGSPHVTPVWIDYDGENVLVNSAHGRTKVTNIERIRERPSPSYPPPISRAAT
jgi:hypothetical protein